jgi:hypothetical protein
MHHFNFAKEPLFQVRKKSTNSDCNHYVYIAAVLVLTVACAGCGSKSSAGTVRGKVLLDDKPLATGTVVTLPSSGRGARGTISNGDFELGTTGDRDGAVVGTHKVAIVAREPSQGVGAEATPGKLLVPQRYTDPEASGLTIEVKAGEVATPTLKLTSQ